MRLIDADNLESDLIFHKNGADYLEDIFDVINEQPTADAVSVVRCKDCVHRKKSNTLPPRCEVFDWFSKKNDYCSFAERISE